MCVQHKNKNINNTYVPNAFSPQNSCLMNRAVFAMCALIKIKSKNWRSTLGSPVKKYSKWWVLNGANHPMADVHISVNSWRYTATLKIFLYD